MYEFLTKVVADSRKYSDYETVEKSQPDRIGHHQLMKCFMRAASSEKKTGRLLFRMVRYFKPNTIIRLGDPLGINTHYLVKGYPKTRLVIIHVTNSGANLTQEIFEKPTVSNIEIHAGNPISLLRELLTSATGIVMIIIDHPLNKETVMECFANLLPSINNNSILIFNNLNNDKEIISAWKEIIKHPKVTATAHLFRLGIVFFKKELSKQDFIIRF